MIEERVSTTNIVYKKISFEESLSTSENKNENRKLFHMRFFEYAHPSEEFRRIATQIDLMEKIIIK